MNSVDILVPDLPESVSHATVSRWYKKTGDSVQRDEVVVEIETDKVVLEIPAPVSGVLKILLENENAIVTSHQVLGSLHVDNHTTNVMSEQSTSQESIKLKRHTTSYEGQINNVSPSTRRLLAEYDLNPLDLKDSGLCGRLTREDIEKYIANHKQNTVLVQSNIQEKIPEFMLGDNKEKRVPMTRLRKHIAERLLEAKKSTAMLTTFNEVNMQLVIDLRKKYGDAFEKRHGIRLGYMSFCIKAALEALKRFPEVNASIDGDDIVYHNYFDVSIAVSTDRGLVTPVLKNIDILSIADIEKKIKEVSIRCRNGKLKVEELIGGNFTITNGGVFGSLMSTPIINPPQSAILGIHVIHDRPMAVRGRVIILPMMYVALSYDHRLIDGKESISFLVTVKQMLEDPARMLLDI